VKSSSFRHQELQTILECFKDIVFESAQKLKVSDIGVSFAEELPGLTTSGIFNTWEHSKTKSF